MRLLPRATLAAVLATASAGACTSASTTPGTTSDAAADTSVDAGVDTAQEADGDSAPVQFDGAGDSRDAAVTDAPADATSLDAVNELGETDVAADEGVDGQAGNEAGSNCNRDPVPVITCTSIGQKFLWICEAGAPPDASMCTVVSSTMDWWCCPQ
jgi:hypothetical protein